MRCDYCGAEHNNVYDGLCDDHLDVMDVVNTVTAYAIQDPNGGEPIVIMPTIRETFLKSIEAAEWLEELNIYSGGSSLCIPPKPGKWGNLYWSGYRVVKVSITRMGEIR